MYVVWCVWCKLGRLGVVGFLEHPVRGVVTAHILGIIPNELLPRH